MLNQIRIALGAGLTSKTSVPMWDYWGSSPDADFPIVGLLWPDSVDVQSSYQTFVFEASAAIWAIDPVTLWAQISEFVDALSAALGPNAPCLPELSALGRSASLSGPIRVGLPSTSAASSTGPSAGGVWVSINFTIRVE